MSNGEREPVRGEGDRDREQTARSVQGARDEADKSGEEAENSQRSERGNQAAAALHPPASGLVHDHAIPRASE